MTEPLLGAYFTNRSNSGMGWLIRTVTSAAVNHAGLYVGDGQVAEATGEGIVLSPIPKDATWSRRRIPAEQRQLIVANAKSLLGTPYDWPGVVRVGLQQFGGDVPELFRVWLDNQANQYLFCSEYVDLVYAMSGIQLFDDGRGHGEVTPVNLDRLILTEERE